MPPAKVQPQRRLRVLAILPILKASYPDARCSLDFSDPLQLLVATILSAQCTDARVNLVTRKLFARCRTAAEYAAIPQADLERLIASTGFFRNKAKNIRAMARTILERHGGEVPRTMDELTALPGVGRKTANVVLGNAFGIDEGIVVDTHVQRLSGLLDLSRQKTPQKIEQDLMRIVPREDWTLWPHLLIRHGREVCIARRPRCEACPLLEHCPSGPKIIARKAGKTHGAAGTRRR